MKNDPPIYTKVKAIKYPKTIHDRSQQKKYTGLRKHNGSIIVTSQTSSLNIAIKTCKQLIIPVTNRRQ